MMEEKAQADCVDLATEEKHLLLDLAAEEVEAGPPSIRHGEGGEGEVELAKLRSTLQSLRSELQSLRSSHATQTSESTLLKSELQSLRASHSTTTSELQSLRTSIRTHRNVAASTGSNHTGVKESYLPQDSFSLLLVAGTRTVPFCSAVGVFVLQLGIFALVTVDLVSSGDGEKNPLGIPADVSPALRTTQFLAILVAVFTQGDLMTGFGAFRDGHNLQIRQLFPHSSYWKYVLSLVARLVEGALGLFVSFLLIVTADTVKDLLLNFTAIEFVSNLDEVFFYLSAQGFMGRSCKFQAKAICETPFLAQKKPNRLIKTILLLSILVTMIIGWVGVFRSQVTGAYLCRTVQVQFDDTFVPALGTFSGLYNLRVPAFRPFSQQRPQYRERRANGMSSGMFAYCDEIKSWTFRWETEEGGGPCVDWVARSAPTETFDFAETGTLQWTVRNGNGREGALDPFHLACFDCGEREICGGNGFCKDAVCQCDDAYYGLRCEFDYPCTTLSIDPQFRGFVSTRDWAETFTLFQLDGKAVRAYDRPVYIHGYKYGGYDILAFTGRRWALTSSEALPLEILGLTDSTTDKELGRYFNNEFHANSPGISFSFLSEPAEVGTAKDSSSPVGLQWFRTLVYVTTSKQNTATSHAVDTAVQTTLFCQECDSLANPCRYDGQCADGTCHCSPGASGGLCQITPTGNGYCNTWFNTPEFRFDNGDCCEHTCHSTPEYRCGYDETGLAFKGYFSCGATRDEWNLHGNPIVGEPFSTSGTAVAMARNGGSLAIAEPGKGRVRLFDKDGGNWVERGASPILNIELRDISISSGPQDLLNSPTFLAPILVAVAGIDEQGNSTGFVFYCTIESCEQEKIFQSSISISLDGLFTSHSGLKVSSSVSLSRDGSVAAYVNGNAVQVFHRSRSTGLEGQRKIAWEERESILLDECIYGVTSYDCDGADYDFGGYGNSGGFSNDNADFTLSNVALSENGTRLVFEARSYLWPMLAYLDHKEHIKVLTMKWNGHSYQQDVSVVANETFTLEDASVLFRPTFGMSNDGDFIVAATSSCEHQAFEWRNDSWVPQGNRIISKRAKEALECSPYLFQGQSIAVADDKTVVIGKDAADTAVFHWNSSGWDQLDVLLPAGPQVSAEVSGDGSMIVVGLPTSELNMAGRTVVYTRLRNPPADFSRLRISVTPDTRHTTWILESEMTKSILLQGGGDAPWDLASVSEKMEVPTDDCYLFTLYPYALKCSRWVSSNCVLPQRLSDPPRFDLWMENEVRLGYALNATLAAYLGDCNRQEYAPRQVRFGNGCSKCPQGTKDVQIMSHFCDQWQSSPTWELQDSRGSAVLSGAWKDGVAWEQACADLDLNSCYTFSVSSLGPPGTTKVLKPEAKAAMSMPYPFEFYIYVDGILFASGGSNRLGEPLQWDIGQCAPSSAPSTFPTTSGSPTTVPSQVPTQVPTKSAAPTGFPTVSQFPTQAPTQIPTFSAPRNVTTTFTIGFGFFEGTEIFLPSEDEVRGVVNTTSLFFRGTLGDRVTSFQLQNPVVLFNESFAYPVNIDFEAFGEVRTGDIASSESLFDFLHDAFVADRIMYITDYVWFVDGLFKNTDTVGFGVPG